MSKNPVVESAIVAPMIANAVNTTKIARLVLDDMFDTIKNSIVYKYCLTASYRRIKCPIRANNTDSCIFPETCCDIFPYSKPI